MEKMAMSARFQHLAMSSSDDEADDHHQIVPAAPLASQAPAEMPNPVPAPVVAQAVDNNHGVAAPQPDADVSAEDVTVDELNTTQERIIPSAAGSPTAVRDMEHDALDAPPSSAFIDCVSAGATYSQFTPQRSTMGEPVLADLLGSAQPPLDPEAAEAAAPAPALTVADPPSEPARPSLLSPAEGSSPSPSDPPPPTSAPEEPGTPEERQRRPTQAYEAVCVTPDEVVPAVDAMDMGSASNLDSSTMTSGKGVLHSLYLDQQRRQQRHPQYTPQSQRAAPTAAGRRLSPDARARLGSSSASRSDSQPSTHSTTPSHRQRRAGSADWADTQQRALAQLRAELEQTSQTPARHASGHLTPRSGGPARAPLVVIEHSDAAHDPPVRAAPPPTTASAGSPPGRDHTMLTVRPNLSAISQISPLRNEVPSILADLYGHSPYSQVAGEVEDLSPFHEDDYDEFLRPRAPSRAQAGAAVLAAVPAASGAALDTSGLPAGDDAHLKWMPREGTPHTSSRVPSPARSPTPGAQRRADGGADAGARLGQRSPSRKPGAAATAVASPAARVDTTARSRAGEHVPSVNLEARERKLRQLKAEAEAREMADCTFHPVISPGTRAMVEMSRLVEAPAAAAAATGASAGLESTMDTTSAAAALTNPVFERLYPEKLVTAASQKRQIEAEMEARTLAREEMLALRRRCRAPFKIETPEASFDVFLSNVLGQDCYEAGALIASTYKSPMAVALIEEKAARRRLAARRRTELRDDVEESQEFRIALFDEFLLRQNAHYFNKARTIQQLEHHLTPSFTPETTQTSSQIVKRLVERSMLDETVDPEEKAQLRRRQARGEPIASALVRKHKSKYEDPCTFHPVISPYAAASQPQKATAPGSAPVRRTNEVPRYETLYQEHKRLAANRQLQQAKAAEAEVQGCTFQPTNLNRKQNARVTSFVEEPNYSRHEVQKRERQLKQDALRAEQALLEEERENRECTFRPRVTKPPAYIARMAKSFGVIRTQDTEF